MAEINVVKRDGSKEPLDIDKFHRVVGWACEGITGVSESEIELKSHIQFYNNIKSSDIQETLIKAAADLISEEFPNYQHVAGRLINYHLRKEVYGGFKAIPDGLYAHVNETINKGYLYPKLLELFDEEDFAQLEKMIVDSRDEDLTYAAME